MEFLDSKITDPAWNLALEQYAFDHLDRSRSYFMLWQNDNTIVIGKNQNTSMEINNEYVKAHNIHVVRRLSGGGAVYHDMGNLNFTFIVDADRIQQINFRIFCQPIIDTLASFGVKAELSGRNDITIDGKKFSGNSQYIREHRVMHHGTMMFDSDLSVVGNALSVSREKIASKGVTSVKSRVTNISAFMPDGVTLADFKKALIEHINAAEKLHEYELTDADLTEIAKIKAKRYDTWEWNYGKSPAYTVRKHRRFEDCGSVELLLTIHKDVILTVSISGDFFGNKDIAKLSEIFTNCPFSQEAIAERLSAVDLEEYIHNLSKDGLVSLFLN